jgi:uncharacterized membrane protein YadS
MVQSKSNTQTGNQIIGFILGLLIVLTLSIAAWWVTKRIYALQLTESISGKIFEYPLWAVILGLVGNVILKATKIHDLVRPGIRTELFLKIGLVLLGAGINFTLLWKGGAGAVIQGLIMITSVFFFSWWLAGKFGLDDKLRAVMSTAISVCGVSAAIAAAGSVMAKKEQVTYITTLVILVALPMMIIMPILGQAMHLPDAVAGAWFGGNIDTTAAVIGAGTIYSDAAQTVAAIVKNTQNLLIGVVAFLLAVSFASRQGEQKGQRPSVRLIWDRFPKFILGFILASILYSLGWIDGGKGTTIDALKSWAFTFAFVSMGLELSMTEFKSMGWKPVAVFLIVTVFNTILALIVAWVIFGKLFPLTI